MAICDGSDKAKANGGGEVKETADGNDEGKASEGGSARVSAIWSSNVMVICDGERK